MRNIVVLLLLVIACTSAAAAAPDDDAVRTAVSAILDSGRHQLELPDQLPARPEQAARADELPLPAEDAAPSEWSGILPEGYPAIARLVFWLLAFAALVYLFLPPILRIRLRVSSRAAVASGLIDANASGEEYAAHPSDVIMQARQLAAAGRAAEALHVLLVGAIGLIGRYQVNSRHRALTNREIANDVREATSAAAFREMVVAGERARFGGRELHDDDINRCCDCLERIRNSLAEVRSAPTLR